LTASEIRVKAVECTVLFADLFVSARHDRALQVDDPFLFAQVLPH
jgi:hypothetical protein